MVFPSTCFLSSSQGLQSRHMISTVEARPQVIFYSIKIKHDTTHKTLRAKKSEVITVITLNHHLASWTFFCCLIFPVYKGMDLEINPLNWVGSSDFIYKLTQLAFAVTNGPIETWYKVTIFYTLFSGLYPLFILIFLSVWKWGCMHVNNIHVGLYPIG